MSSFTLKPRQIVSELDRFVIGQDKAKKAVSIALRNRWRRMQVPKPLRDEIMPKNIIMMGPTGVGKTEIARRLARLCGAPFIKVEATKFTEVGYVGKDAEAMIRELVDIAVGMLKSEEEKRVRGNAKQQAEERLLELLVSQSSEPASDGTSKGKMASMLKRGELDKLEVSLPAKAQAMIPPLEIVAATNLDDMSNNLKDLFSNIFPRYSSKEPRKVKVPEALQILESEEAGKLVEKENIAKRAVELVEQNGIVFIDEVDKIASRAGEHRAGPDISREGVQRDILPIVEGSSVMTKHGMVRTDHILFVAAGAFHATKPSDLIPELQGRFPIRVELDSLGEKEFNRILTEPDNSLIKQYIALMATEGIELEFTKDGITELAKIAAVINSRTEDIGARRLHTVLEKVLEDISFTAPDKREKKVKIDASYVKERLSDIAQDRDLSRYIL